MANLQDGMLENIRGLGRQLEQSLALPVPRISLPAPDRILVLGTGGGSAMAGEMLRRLMDRPGRSPVSVCGEYRPPAWVGRKTLVLATSHSGNTKETLASVGIAAKAGAAIVALTAGGRLEALAKAEGWAIWPLTPGVMPRALLGELLAGMARLLKGAGLYPEADEDLALAAQALKRGIAARERTAAQAARRLKGLIPYLIGAEPATAVCAQRLKNQLGENGKLVSLAVSLPRAHHDEIVGWDQPLSLSRRLGVVLLRDSQEDPEIVQRFAATRGLVARRAGALIELRAAGKGLLERMLTLAQTCDFLSAHAALLRGVSPTPVPIIDELKRRMRQ